MKFSSLRSALAVAASAMGLAALVQSAPAPSADIQDIGERSISNGFNNIVYFTNWGIYGRNYQPADLPADVVTHVLYSFANVRSDGTVFLSDTYADLEKHYPSDSWNDVGNNVYGCAKQLFLLKKQNRRMKVILSIGGWTYSANFPGPASTEAGRRQFAATAVAFVKDLGLDGLDVDWEYPRDATEARNWTLLLQACRQALDAYTAQYGGSRQILSVAVPAGPTNYQRLDIRGMTQYVDMWNLMAYDYMGSFSNRTGHQANMYPSRSNPASTDFNTEQAVNYYIAQGVPSRNINLGIPLYGRAFANTNGLGQPFNGVGDGSWEPGIWDYKVLPQAGAEVRTDSESGATYSYDSQKKLLISYDNQAMVSRKKDYILSKSLGGGMYWEASGDRTGDQSLMRTVYNGLRAAGAMDTSSNTISYPGSVYDNMRNGMN